MPLKYLLLFDIDGTILLTGGAGMRSMVRAGKDVFGPAMNWNGIELSGGLDPILVALAAERSGLPFTPKSLEAFRDRYVLHLREELRLGSSNVRAMPGVLELLGILREREDVTLGLLTGNFSEGAALKLTAVGVDPAWFPVAVYADEAGSRPGLVRIALSKYETLNGHPSEPSRVIVIGDSPKDVDCALSNGCIAFGVATGKFSAETLLAAGAHRAVKDLSDPEPLLGLLS